MRVTNSKNPFRPLGTYSSKIGSKKTMTRTEEPGGRKVKPNMTNPQNIQHAYEQLSPAEKMIISYLSVYDLQNLDLRAGMFNHCIKSLKRYYGDKLPLLNSCDSNTIITKLLNQNLICKTEKGELAFNSKEVQSFLQEKLKEGKFSTGF